MPNSSTLTESGAGLARLRLNTKSRRNRLKYQLKIIFSISDSRLTLPFPFFNYRLRLVELVQDKVEQCVVINLAQRTAGLLDLEEYRYHSVPETHNTGNANQCPLRIDRNWYVLRKVELPSKNLEKVAHSTRMIQFFPAGKPRTENTNNGYR